MLISVCICTFKRPGVTGTLASVLSQALPPGTDIEIVVVDNDPMRSAEATVAAVALGTSVPVKYAMEPARNISLARNRALSFAVGDWLALIDDDEIADSNWLAALLAAAEGHGADAVIGRVDALYPPGTPGWLLAADPLSRRWGASGTVLTTGSSANALLNRDVLIASGVHFDEAFGRSGGEDTDFFNRLHLAGARIVASDTALVRERVPVERLRPAYLRRRAVRAGHSYGLIRLRALSPAGRIYFFAVSMVKAALFAACSATLLAVARATAMKLGIRGWLNFGKLRACAGFALPAMY